MRLVGCIVLIISVLNWAESSVPGRPERCKPKPQDCSPNETYNFCGSICQKTCKNRYSPQLPCPPVCNEGCECNPGLLRHDNNTCVPPYQCSKPVCPLNSHYERCGTACQSTCQNLGKPIAPCIEICIEGCFCDIGYIKNNFSECIKPKDCPQPVCGINEVPADCAIVCPPQTCESMYTDYACLDNIECRPGCNCKNGYLRNSSGICIPSDECPPYSCPKNEKWVDCVLGLCAPKNCEDLGQPVPCPDIKGPCEGGCVCDDNFLRNIDGICVPTTDCPGCGGDNNATAGCSNYCGNTCDDYYNKKPRGCPLFCEYNGCSCKKGYVYNGDIKKCVLPKDCPCAPQLCPKNEVWEDCVQNVCIVKKCSDLGYPLNCTKVDDKDCEGGCICATGYSRDRKGQCVPIDSCPSCHGDKNATLGCSNYCGHSCSDYQEVNKVCPLGCILNGCKCREGYVYNPDIKQCVLPKDCRNKPCGTNEIFVGCNIKCPTDYCPENDNRGILVMVCEPPLPCPSGCRCKLNYKRNNKKDNRCILASECPPVKCTRPNEVWDPCPSACLREDCGDVYDQPTTCNTLVLNCQPQCVCKNGYFRNDSAICIRAKDCYPCGPNEKYLENTNECQRSCYDRNPNAPPSLCSPSSGCFCNPGYLRLNKNGDGPCVPINRCPSTGGPPGPPSPPG